MSSVIHIRHIESEEERDAAIEYISTNLHRMHGACPPPQKTPPCIFIALEGTSIVGSLAVQFGEKETPLPIEELFSFDTQNTYPPYIREQTVYLSRWNASRANIGLALWLKGSQHAEEIGRTYSCLTVKDTLLDKKPEFKSLWYPILDAKIRMVNIEDCEIPYFLEGSPPRPWLGILKEQIISLSQEVDRIKKYIPIVF